MKQNDGWSKPYAYSLATNKSCLRQSNAFDKSVSSILPTPLLSKIFFNFSTIRKRLWWVLWPCRNPHWRLEKIWLIWKNFKHTLLINFGKNEKDTNGTIIFDSKFALLFINGYVSFFQSWGKNWTEQWVIEVMMYKVRKY